MLLEDRELLAKYREGMAAYIRKKYDWEEIGTRLDTLLREILKKQ